MRVTAAGLTQIAVWGGIIATLLSPFGPSLYEAFSTEDLHFIYSFEYQRNPVLEWNRQISVALKRLDESIKDADELPKSIIKSLTRELVANAPALAAATELRPFDSLTVRIVNVSHQDLRDIRVQFHGCTGYDSHTTYPDSFASPESPEQLRKSPDPLTITYRKINRQTPDTIFQGFIKYFGDDTSACQPSVYADLGTGKSAIGRKENIDDFQSAQYETKKSWERWSEVIFKLVLFGIVLFLFIRVRALDARLRQADS